jgi:polar amino acid transport system substrate-binding protein
MTRRCLILPLLLLALLGCKPSPTNALRVGMELNYPPFETQDRSGKPDGVSVKIAEALARDLGRPLTIVPMEFGSLTTALKTGNIDLVISSMTATEERRQTIDFSEPYAFTALALLVAKDSPVQSIDDLKSSDRRIAVKSSTSSEAWATKHLPDTKRTAFSDDAACVLEVVQGRADAFLYDQLSIYRYQKKNPDTTRALLQPFTEETWAIGLAKGNDELLRKTNAFLTKFRAEGGFEKLAQQYLSEEKNAMEAAGIPFMLR